MVTQVAERHDNIVKLRNENRDIEEKLREALASASHRGEVIKQLRDEIKQYQGKVRFFVHVIDKESVNSKCTKRVLTRKYKLYRLCMHALKQVALI